MTQCRNTVVAPEGRDRWPAVPPRALGYLGVALSMALAACAVWLLRAPLVQANNLPNCPAVLPARRYSPAARLALAGGIITVTRGDDAGFCFSSETLRCAIDYANSSGPFTTIEFAPAVTQVMFSSALPPITSRGTFINGALPGGMVTINAASVSAGNTLVISADDVLVFDVSLINTPSDPVDIAIHGGRGVLIGYSHLGVVPGATNCNFPGHVRNSVVGVDVSTSTGDNVLGSAYLFGNVIGCHTTRDGNGAGMTVEASWMYLGQDIGGSPGPNYIGVQPSGQPIPNDSGVYFSSVGGIITSTHNTVWGNPIADNLGDGIDLVGSATTNNLISGTVLYGNGLDGICEDHAASNNVWTHVSLYQNSRLGISTNGDCYSQPFQNDVIAPPYPIITSVDPATQVVRGTASPSASCPIFCVTVELYRVYPNPRGFGEGKTFIGATTTDSQGRWVVTDPAFAGGCYTAFETTFLFSFSGSHDFSSEFGPDNCRTWLPLTQK